MDYLKRNQTASSREIARALQMTPANARHHLGILNADGRVEFVSRRQVGKGRPEKVYRLAGTLAGDNLSALADALLAEAGANIEMEALGKRIAGENLNNQPLMRKLSSVVERLNEMHYQARWEAGAEGPRIVFGHCPYIKIIDSHPKLCQMDSALLSEMLSETVLQTAKFEIGAGERPFCAFVLQTG